MSSFFHTLLWFVVSCRCVRRTFTPTANNGRRLAGQSWLAAAFKLMNCLFTITTITTHEENALFCVTRIRVWLICRSSEILFHLVSKWIKICELKLCLFCLSCRTLRMGCVFIGLSSPLNSSNSTSLQSVTQVTKMSSGVQKNGSEASFPFSWSPGPDLWWAAVFRGDGWRLLKL